MEDYILSGKLYCGHCLSAMVGTSGTSKTGKLHSYYKEKAKGCKNLTVHKHKIEDKVIEMAREMLTDENMKLIARKISALCEQEKDNPNVKRLKRLIKDNEKAKANLLESLKVGKASATAANYVFAEIDKLEKEYAELEKRITVEENQQFGLSEVDIMYFLTHLKSGNIDDVEYRKLLVNSMVNVIYLYQDDGGFTVSVLFNSSNQPVKVDAALLDEIKKDESSYALSPSPPTIEISTLCR